MNGPQVSSPSKEGRSISAAIGAALFVSLAAASTAVTGAPVVTGEIGDFVWNDLNRNGVQDAGEPGLQNVRVNLLLPDVNTVIAATSTDANGLYRFSGLAGANYRVEFITPSGYVPTVANAPGSTPQNDSNLSPGPVTLPSDNSVDLTIDAGYFIPCTASIGDFVWNDLNRNGIQDAGEPGLKGATVKLWNAFDTLIATTTSDANGHYQFTGLCAGDYEIMFDELAGFLFTTPNIGSDASLDSNGSTSRRTDVSLMTDLASNQTIDAGLIAIPEPGMLALLGLGLAGLAASRRRKQ